MEHTRRLYIDLFSYYPSNLTIVKFIKVLDFKYFSQKPKNNVVYAKSSG